MSASSPPLSLLSSRFSTRYGLLSSGIFAIAKLLTVHNATMPMTIPAFRNLLWVPCRAHYRLLSPTISTRGRII